MMMNLAAAQQSSSSSADVTTPTKRWSRDHLGAAVTVGEYDYFSTELGWGVIPREQHASFEALMIRYPTTRTGDPRDCGASAVPFATEGEGEDDELRRRRDEPTQHGLDAVNKFRDLVDRLQHRMAHPDGGGGAGDDDDGHRSLEVPMMQLSKYFVPAKLEEHYGENDDEKKEDAAKGEALFSSFDAGEAIRDGLDPDLVERLEQRTPGITNKIVSRYLRDGAWQPESHGCGVGSARRHVNALARRYLASVSSPPGAARSRPGAAAVHGNDEGGLVARFVAQMERACAKNHEQLVLADGRLHKAAFARLVKLYLAEAAAATPRAGGGARRGLAERYLTRNEGNAWTDDDDDAADEGNRPRRGTSGKKLVDRFLEGIQDALEEESVVDAEGNFDSAMLEAMVTRYLVQATGLSADAVRRAEDLEALEADGGEAKDGSPCDRRSSRTGTATAGDDFDGDAAVAVDFFVERFGSLLERAVDRESELCEDDMSLDADCLERLTVDCLDRAVLDYEVWEDGEVRSAMARGETGRAGLISVVQSPEFLERLLAYMRRAAPDDAADGPSLVTADGKVDKSALKWLVDRYLREAAAETRSPSPEDLPNGIVNGQHDGGSGPFGPGRHSLHALLSPSSNSQAQGVTGDQRHLRVGGPLTSSTRSVVSDFTNNRSRRLLSRIIMTAGGGGDHRSEAVGYAGSSALLGQARTASGLLSDSVSNRVGGFMKNMLYGNKQQKQQLQHDQHSEELEAVAAFRKSQEERCRDERECSSVSSFRVLPDGIKQVVQNLRGRIPEEEDDEECFSYSEGYPYSEGAAFHGESLLEEASVEPYFDDEDDEDRSQSTASLSTRQSHRHHRLDAELSPERIRHFHQKVMEKSALIGPAGADMSIIDTDGNSEVAGGVGAISNLLLSPTILTKRHQQAIRAVEQRNWDQVSYLLSANPWLAEMMDVNTNQYLLHKVALYGAGGRGGEDNAALAAPDSINFDLVRMFPAAVHKFDRDGNLPLHMAAASANTSMIRLLGDRFASGASVRNEDGMLPLHLVLLAIASPQRRDRAGPSDADHTGNGGGAAAVAAVLEYFTGAVAVADNGGNLPLHTAASGLSGDEGAEVVYALLDEAERQIEEKRLCATADGADFGDSDGKHCDRTTAVSLRTCTSTESPVTMTDASSSSWMSSSKGGGEGGIVGNGGEGDGDDTSSLLHGTSVRNDSGETPLLAAIHHGAGWQVIEALARATLGGGYAGGRGGAAALSKVAADDNENNVLHLLVGGQYKDPAAALSILKVAPEAARVRNHDGMLPIEIACTERLPREVVLALVLVDLPIDLDVTNDNRQCEFVQQRERQGSSWWYLVCDCEDRYADVVEEVVSICSYPQLREMCFMTADFTTASGCRSGSFSELQDNDHDDSMNETLLSRATPRCRDALQRALRFLGRFEFLGSAAVHSDVSAGLKVFDALDFGTPTHPVRDGRRVILKCYAREETFARETSFLREQHKIDFSLVEEILTFAVGQDGTPATDNAPKQFCVSIERPNLTLAGVVEGMLGNEECQTDSGVRRRYAIKVFAVLKTIAQALAYLHSSGYVHGNVGLETCGKYDDDAWKLSDILGMQKVGMRFEWSRFSPDSAPPESMEPAPGNNNDASVQRATFRTDLRTHPSIDVWAFGRLTFEALVGESLIVEDRRRGEERENQSLLLQIMHWNDFFDSDKVRRKLRRAGASKISSEMVAQCLAAEPERRPTMEQILRHAAWQQVQKQQQLNPGGGSSSRAGRWDSTRQEDDVILGVDGYEFHSGHHGGLHEI